MTEHTLFHSLIRDVVAHPRSGASVLADRHQQCAYAEIPGFLEQIQRLLLNQGIRAGDALVLELNNSVRAALSVLALLDAGVSFMTMPVPGQGARAGESRHQYPRFARWILSVSTDKPKGSLGQTLPSELLQVRPNEQHDVAADIPGEEDPRLFFRTSGSLGTVKLAAYRYDSFYGNTLNALKIRRFDSSHRIALPTPIFHVYGLGAGFLAGFVGGSSIDFQERSNVLRYFEREADFEPNVAYVTPSFCEMLIRSRRSPRPYRFMITSGDRISESTFKRSEDLHGTMINQYGATELGFVAASEVEAPFDLRCRTVGRPVDGVKVRIVAVPGSSGNDCGELQVQHAYGFEGYVDLNGERIEPPGAFDGDWYRTGDLTTVTEDGNLVVLGRCDLSVNRSGVLLPLADVESRMRELSGVEEVAVVAASTDDLRGRTLVAFCVVNGECEESGLELRSRFAAKAPPFAVPEIVHLVPALPKLESGKIDRVALAKLAEEIKIANA
jgi:acyl-coenzyme A synthetase/AMP-(fatty) acid ligase